MLAEMRAAVSEAETAYIAAKDNLARLREQRRPLAIAASSDGEASAELRRNREEIVDAELLVADTAARLEAAKNALAAAEHAEADAEAAQRLAQAREIAAELLGASAAFDAAIAEARRCLDRRESFRAKLAQSGCLRDNVAVAVSSPSRVRRAFAVHLENYLVERIPRRHAVALAESDQIIVGALQRPPNVEAAA